MNPAELISAECDAVKEMLLAKNKAYGNSALEPLRVFSKASSVEQILVRINDKLSRTARGSADGEDIEKDIVGYLILLRIAKRMAPKQAVHVGLNVRAAICEVLAWYELDDRAWAKFLFGTK